jgi:hypothetical protein
MPTSNPSDRQEYGNNGQCNHIFHRRQPGEVPAILKAKVLRSRTSSITTSTHRRRLWTLSLACTRLNTGWHCDSGFDGFRALLFQQGGGLDQAGIEAGLDLNIDFFIGMLNGMNFGDLLLDISDQIRPFEVKKGETDRVLRECVEYMYEVMKARQPYKLEGKLADVSGRDPGLPRRQSFWANSASAL